MVRGAPNAGGVDFAAGKEPPAAGGFTPRASPGSRSASLAGLNPCSFPRSFQSVSQRTMTSSLVVLEDAAPAAIDRGDVPLEPVRCRGRRPPPACRAREVLRGLRLQHARVREAELGRCVARGRPPARPRRRRPRPRCRRPAPRGARGCRGSGGAGGQLLRAAGGRGGEVEVAEAQGDLGLGDEIRGRGVVALEERRELVEGLAELLLREVNGHPLAAQHGLGGGLILRVEAQVPGLGDRRRRRRRPVTHAEGAGRAARCGRPWNGASGRGAVRVGASCHGADPGGSRATRVAAAGGAALVSACRARRRAGPTFPGDACVRTRGCATIRAMSTSNDAARRRR